MNQLIKVLSLTMHIITHWLYNINANTFLKSLNLKVGSATCFLCMQDNTSQQPVLQVIIFGPQFHGS